MVDLKKVKEKRENKYKEQKSKRIRIYGIDTHDSRGKKGKHTIKEHKIYVHFYVHISIIK